MNGWENDKSWSDKFLPEIKRHLGQTLISTAPIQEDQERNTDLIVLTMAPLRIACRIRRFDQFAPYGHQFTIREGRPSGAKTELTKIIEGWGDYLFYGFSDKAENGLQAWGIADLKVFRIWFMRELANCKPLDFPGIGKKNTDKSSTFRAFMWHWFPGEFLLAQCNLKITNKCDSCERTLQGFEIKAGRTQCFNCYSDHQD